LKRRKFIILTLGGAGSYYVYKNIKTLSKIPSVFKVTKYTFLEVQKIPLVLESNGPILASTISDKKWICTFALMRTIAQISNVSQNVESLPELYDAPLGAYNLSEGPLEGYDNWHPGKMSKPANQDLKCLRLLSDLNSLNILHRGIRVKKGQLAVRELFLRMAVNRLSTNWARMDIKDNPIRWAEIHSLYNQYLNSIQLTG